MRCGLRHLDYHQIWHAVTEGTHPKGSSDHRLSFMLRVSSPHEPEKLKQRGEDLSGATRLKVAILGSGGMKMRGVETTRKDV